MRATYYYFFFFLLLNSTFTIHQTHTFFLCRYKLHQFTVAKPSRPITVTPPSIHNTHTHTHTHTLSLSLSETQNPNSLANPQKKTKKKKNLSLSLMEDPEGVLSFDFEGGLDAGPTAATAANPAATSGPHIIQSDSAAIHAANNNNNNSNNANVIAVGHAAVPGGGGGGGGEAGAGNYRPGGRSFRQTVCRHWLRSLCMKGDACGFLHQYDKSRMPVCRFFRLYGECREQDCVYKHTNEDIKECNMYVFIYVFVTLFLLFI